MLHQKHGRGEAGQDSSGPWRASQAQVVLGSQDYGFQAVGLALRLIQSDAELSSHCRIF